jgi:hypothetical protein
MSINIISLSGSVPGAACGIAISIKKNIYNNNKETDFFDYLICSMKSINEILKGKTIDFENKCLENGIIKVLNRQCRQM